MGTYEQFMDNRAKSNRCNSETSMEDRLNAAMDVDEMFTDAKLRLRTFVDAYLAEYKARIAWLENPPVSEDEEQIHLVVAGQIQSLASVRPVEGGDWRLLLDDLRIVLDMLGGSR